MTNEIIKELWAIKDAIAGEHNYDIDSLINYFQNSVRYKDQHFVDLSASKPTSGQEYPATK